jgi:hypothetical protein
LLLRPQLLFGRAYRAQEVLLSSSGVIALPVRNREGLV